jgi:CubicO group peptidase (beta-lactamase class C family)
MQGSAPNNFNRRAFLSGVGQTAATLAIHPLVSPNATAQASEMQGSPVDPALNTFIQRYLKEKYAPGLTLGLVHPNGSTSASSFGLSDVAKKLPVTPAMLFQIGSISKCFCALILLQLRDEGKLDVQRPILEYLPWLPIETVYGPVTVHHLLIHSSGLPSNSSIFLPDRNARQKQSFKPSTQFSYCNMGYQILGELAASLDGRTYAAALKARILDPLGMSSTRPAISIAIRPDEAQSYVVDRDDLAQGSDAPLVVAPRAVFDHAAGCIASTPADMTLYMKMLLARGVGPKGRIVSEEGFTLFSTPYIAADEFGPGTQYGYGIAVDTLDKHKVLRHTGGMQSFASSMYVDLDGDMAAFASINAMQGYRPNPVTKYAIQLMRAQTEKKPLPEAPKPEDAWVIENAADYASTFSGDAGAVQVVAEGTALLAIIGGERVPLQRAGGDSFAAKDAKWQQFPWVFTRAEPSGADKKALVTELVYGAHWYTNANYKGPKSFPVPKRLAGLEGYYDDGTSGFHVLINKGTLLIDGSERLTEIGEGLFRSADDPNSPETLEFLHFVDGRARMAVASGEPYWRVEIA